MLGTKQKKKDENKMQYLEKALAYWKDAQNYFENVSDPDLIEFAIYDMKAAQQRYEYMVKCAKRGDLQAWEEHPIKLQSIPLSDPILEQTQKLDKQAIHRLL